MPSNDLRRKMTETIVTAIDNGVRPWKRAWSLSLNTGRPANVISKRAYSGANPLLLEIHRQHHRELGHALDSRWYGTFRQWADLGMSVKKRPDNVKPGEWGARIVFYRPVSKTKVDPATGEERKDEFWVTKSYVVFSADQVEGDGIERFQVTDADENDDTFVDYEPVERLLENSGADIRFHGDRAFYDRLGDYIVLPPKSRFNGIAEFYSTALHEASHWAEKRVQWDYEKHGYAMTELVAEISASFLASELRVPDADINNSASYVANWLEAMRGDPNYIFRASTAASKSADFLLSFVEQESRQPEPAIIV